MPRTHQCRFLWTTGHLVDDSWVPWDLQVANAAPQTIVWKKGTTKLQIRIPGLYRYALECLDVCCNEDVFAVMGTVDVMFGQQCYKPETVYVLFISVSTRLLHW
jgi:hypothetical protein